MAAGGSKLRGTRKSGGGFRTPRLSDAQKRYNRATRLGKRTALPADGSAPF